MVATLEKPVQEVQELKLPEVEMSTDSKTDKQDHPKIRRKTARSSAMLKRTATPKNKNEVDSSQSLFKEMDDVLSNSEGLKLFNIFAFLLFSILAIGTFYAIHFLSR